MHHSKTVKDYVWEYFLIIVGSLLYAAGLRFFFYPNDIIAGGVTGIAMIINYLTDAPVGVMNLVINIPLFIWAWKGFGLKFIIGSFVATVLCSVLVDLYAYFDIVATDNMLLAAIYGGVLNGLGLGLVYRAGDTTGGIDIVAKFVRRRYPYVNFGTIILILDIVIYAAFAVIFNEFEGAMYALIAMFVVTRVKGLLHHQRRERQAQKRYHRHAGPRRHPAQRRGRIHRQGKERNTLRYQETADNGRPQNNQVNRYARIPDSDRGQERLRQRLRRYN